MSRSWHVVRGAPLDKGPEYLTLRGWSFDRDGRLVLDREEDARALSEAHESARVVTVTGGETLAAELRAERIAKRRRHA